jgi:hypothetical protein
MKRFISLAFALILSLAAAAQKEVRLEDVGQHVGDSVVLTGKVAGGRYFPQGEGVPTLLNIGAPYPHQLLTVVIRGTARKEFAGAPEKDLLNKEVRVAGKVELYKGKPQVMVYSAAQLTIAEEPKTGSGQ